MWRHHCSHLCDNRARLQRDNAPAGLRHTQRHSPTAARTASPVFKPAAQSATANAPSAMPPASPPATLKRVNTCPHKLATTAPVATLVKTEYSKRNHKQFLELYELGAVVGTGGYAVVRECVRKSTGQKFAAKMMTVSDSPESGGRDIDRQVCASICC